MNKNLKVVYFSPTDGTKKIVKTIAQSIDTCYEEFDITLPQNRVNDITFSSDDLLIIGMPTYGGRLPKLLHNYLKKINGDNTLAVFICTYGNREYEDALLEECDIFNSQGFKTLGAGAFITEHSIASELAAGRPDASDLKTAADFGLAILRRLKEMNSLAGLKTIEVPGNRPYVEKNSPPMLFGPETNDKCIACRVCAEHCPTGAIDFSDCKTIDISKCIRCNSCIKRCPLNAKSITAEPYKNLQNMLIKNFAENAKTPEIFLA